MSSRQSFGATDAGLLLMALIWGINYSVVKAGLHDLSPLAFNALRVALAAVTLAVVALGIRSTPWPTRGETVRLLSLGLIGNGLYQLFFILGIARTPVGVTALMFAAGPAYIAIIAHLVGRERLPRRGWAGIGLQLIGVACVAGSARGGEAGGNPMLGTALIASGSIMWAIYSVSLQPYTKRAHPIHLSAITMASGALFLLIAAAPTLWRLDVTRVPLATWGAIGYSGVGALVIAYLLFYRGVRDLGPTKTAMYGNLQPIVAIAVAWIVLSERPTGWQLLGAAFIMSGLLLSRTTSSRVSHTASTVVPETVGS